MLSAFPYHGLWELFLEIQRQEVLEPECPGYCLAFVNCFWVIYHSSVRHRQLCVASYLSLQFPCLWSRATDAPSDPKVNINHSFWTDLKNFFLSVSIISSTMSMLQFFPLFFFYPAKRKHSTFKIKVFLIAICFGPMCTSPLFLFLSY